MSTMITDTTVAAPSHTDAGVAGTSTVRLRSSVTSVSWIPSHGVPGAMALPFESAALHYDAPPPEHLLPGDLARLAADGRFRVANELSAWIDVDIDEDGVRHIVGFGQDGQGWITSTDVSVAGLSVSFPPGRLPDLRPAAVVGDGWVRFTQTTGGRSGVFAPRRTGAAPFVAWRAPVVWTTLELTLHADGTSEHRLVSASPFPRHWVYDGEGDLVAKTGWLRFRYWYHQAVQQRSPWAEPGAADRGARRSGDERGAGRGRRATDRTLVAPAESDAEHQVSHTVMRHHHDTKRLRAGQELLCQGDDGDDVFLVLDGMLRVEVDGRGVGEIGPGAVVGERAVLGDGRRTATLRAVTPVRVAVAASARVGLEALSPIEPHHQREHR